MNHYLESKSRYEILDGLRGVAALVVVFSWAQRFTDAPLGTHVMVAIGTLAIALFIAWAALKLYDEPVREWLKEHWLKKK